MSLILALLAQAAPAQPTPDADPYEAGRAIIADINRIVTPDGVQETFELTLGGTLQVVNVRGADRANPILLFIHGGPGAVEMPIAWTFQRPWEDFFTVVQWDQRGAGRSYRAAEAEALKPTLTVDRYRDDAIALIEALGQRYGRRKVFVLGHSWGSVVGMAVAAKRPDLLHAYIGMGQIIDMRENERVGIAWTVAQAERRGDRAALREIDALKPYPDSGPFVIEKADSWRKWAVRYGALAAGRADANYYLRAPRLSPEYTPADIQSWYKGSELAVQTLWPRLADVSYRSLTRLDVPVVMFLGRHDYTTPSPIAARWLARVRAPRKALIWFEHSAHLPMIEQPGRVLKALIEDVLPLAKDEGAR